MRIIIYVVSLAKNNENIKCCFLDQMLSDFTDADIQTEFSCKTFNLLKGVW